MFDQGLNQEFGFDNSIIGNNNMMMSQDMNMGNMSNPINEAVQERVVNRTFVHEVPHVCY